MRSIPALVLALLTGFIISGCSDTSRPHHKYIPESTDLVARVKMKQLGMKSMSWQEALSVGFRQTVMGGSSSDKEGGLNLVNSGLDFLNDVYVFARAGDGDLPFYSGVSFALSDVANFRSFVSELKGSGEIKKSDGVNWVTLKQHSCLAGWTGNNGIIVYTKGETGKYFREHFLSLFSLDEKRMLVNADERFRSFHDQQEGDIGVWLNSSDLSGLLNGTTQGATQLPYNAFLDQSWLTAETWFEQGEIRTKLHWHLNNFTGKQANNLLKNEIDAGLVHAVAGDSSVGVVGLGVKPSMANNAFQFLQMGLLPEGSPLSERKDALVDLLSGDIAVSLRKLIMPEVPDTADAMERASLKYLVPERALLTGIGVDNVASVDKFLQYMVQQGKIAKAGNSYLFKKDKDSLWLMPGNNHFFISNRASLTGVTENNAAPPPDFPTSRFTNNPLAYYMNFGCLPERLTQVIQDFEVLGHQLVPVFRSVEGSAKIRQDSILEGTNKFLLRNDSVNSVKVLRKAFTTKEEAPL